eukprot:TRINITY_DN22736_c0_g1_i1.p2 TRINITY_DN22736_c0_g1~~TRINITY_DN22736_c0_g1_i1.p2  ORF type:complete len:142 (-),score=24.64 TRINITY_DN22736_c0_g1_i1:43-468(-)
MRRAGRLWSRRRSTGRSESAWTRTGLSEYNSHVIRQIDGLGFVDVVAGVPGTSGFVNGPASTALCSHPFRAMPDGADGVLVSDHSNHCIRKIVGTTVSTWAGVCTSGGTSDGAVVLGSCTSQQDCGNCRMGAGTLRTPGTM